MSQSDYSWLQERVSSAIDTANRLEKRFLWDAHGAATGSDVATCEQQLGCALSESHRAFLRRSNGVRIGDAKMIDGEPILAAQVVIFSTEEIVLEKKNLSEHFDEGTVDPRKLWGALIPLVDWDDFNYVLGDPTLAYDDHEYAIRFANHELGPEWWRRQLPIATSFHGLIARILDYYIEHGALPDSREDFLTEAERAAEFTAGARGRERLIADMVQLKAAQRAFFLSQVNRGPAAGSDYRALMAAPRQALPMKLSGILFGTRYAIVGGVATRLYQPERFTNNIDALVVQDDLPLLREHLTEAGGQRVQSIAMPDSSLGLRGEVWGVEDIGEVEVLWTDQKWVNDAVRSALTDEQGLAIVGLAYLVAMKLDASRSIDHADLSRMLGIANDVALADVRRVVAELLPTVAEDLERYIEIGRLEVGNDRDAEC